MKTQETALSGQKQASSTREPVTPIRVSWRSPKLRHHKPTGQGYVVLNGKYIFFGPYATPDVTEQYHRAIAYCRMGRQRAAMPGTIIHSGSRRR